MGVMRIVFVVPASSPLSVAVCLIAGAIAVGVIGAMAYQATRKRRTIGSDEMSDYRRVREADMMKSKVNVSAVVQIVIYVISIVLAYAALDKRITSLEVKYDRVVEDVKEIKADVKTLLNRQP